MPEIKSSFLQGKMNKDLDDRILPKGQYRDAENIKIAKSDSSNVGAAQNIKGNTIQYTTSLGLPTSTAINLNDEIFSLSEQMIQLHDYTTMFYKFRARYGHFK